MPLHRLFNYTIILLIIFSTGKVIASIPPKQHPVDFEEIKQYAIFSDFTYLTASDIRKLNFSKNYSLSHYGNIPEIKISYYLITNDITKTQIIAVRGTSNIENAIVDVALKLTLDRHAAVYLHNGFSQAAQAIYTDIQPHLKSDYVISSTGHSLGGAVALIIAMYLDVDKFVTGQIVTFGQPKVTNIAGANTFKHLNVTRVVTPKDIVPLVPPFDPVDFNNLDIYWHLGKELILLAGTDFSILEGLNSMIRATKFTQEPLDENNLKNHQMTLYLQMLDNKIPTARMIPFKNSLNLFNSFGSD